MKDKSDILRAANRVFDAMPDPPVASIEPFNHEKACGLVIRWAKKGVGFGEITLAIDKKGEDYDPTTARVDTEGMGVEFVGEMLMALNND